MTARSKAVGLGHDCDGPQPVSDRSKRHADVQCGLRTVHIQMDVSISLFENYGVDSGTLVSHNERQLGRRLDDIL